jgi:hypothetical protein
MVVVSVATQQLAVKSCGLPWPGPESGRPVLLRHMGDQRPSFSILWMDGSRMPSLFRFLTLIGVLGGLIYGAMFMLATWFDPKPREITVSVPPDRFAKQP